MKIEYTTNNSGGGWWLKDKDWDALSAAGWDVEWYKQPFLGAKATAATKEFETPADAMREFEKLTGSDVCDEGCNCCGAPHSFSWVGGSASGEGCLQHLYENAPTTLREAAELLKNGEK